MNKNQADWLMATAFGFLGTMIWAITFASNKEPFAFIVCLFALALTVLCSRKFVKSFPE